MAKVSFVHYQSLETALPGLEIEIAYHCEAEITIEEDGEDVTILELSVKVNGQATELPAWPSESTADGRRFYALMREAARDAHYKQSIQERKHRLEFAQMFPSN